MRFSLLATLALTLTACPPTDKPVDDTGRDTDVPAVDEDGDGYLVSDGDCDDGDDSVHPGAEEACDGLDNDCDDETDEDGGTTWYVDADADGYGDPGTSTSACDAPAGYVADATDCDDTSDRYHPGADESDCTDPEDYNCDGGTGFADTDGDGYAACEDCDDAEPNRNPGALEACNELDDNCDGTVDEDAVDMGTWYMDADADGYGDDTVTVAACGAPAGYVAVGGDCDDADAAYSPGAVEDDCADPNDYNCDGSVAYEDADADGWAACEDCDDATAGVNPSAAEACNEVDDDCDGAVDEDALDAVAWYTDADLDGYGDPATAVVTCDMPEGAVATGDDCDDASALFHPDADESDCTDPNDYNCDGSTTYADADGDGFVACEECDDTSAAVNPGAAEACNTVDDDCDGVVDESDAVDVLTWYRDADADGHGEIGTTAVACDAPTGFVAAPDDCDDASALYHPGADESDCTDPNDYNCDGAVAYADGDADGWAACEDCDDALAAVRPDATEVCNDRDDDCDSTVDEPDAADASTWYADADGDLFGNPASTTIACDAPLAYVASATDCDDTVASVFPGAAETCDDVDQDCDGAVDEDAVDTVPWYADADIDGYGDAEVGVSACDAPSGYLADATDCDDGASAVHPGATETCDDVDQDCDGAVDDSATDMTTWFADTDGDGFGLATATLAACDAPDGYVGTGDDCDDALAAVHPGAAETCDDVDQDCDSVVDEGATDATTWYADADSDGLGDPGVSVASCDAPTGYVAAAGDCDDGDAAVGSAGVETCNGVDDDCDGAVDEIGAVGGTSWWADADGDLYGDPATEVSACSAPVGHIANGFDCDDTTAATSPSASETCDDVDNNCNGLVDEDVTTGAPTWYADADLDGYGDPADAVVACDAPEMFVADATDCDDTEPTVSPGASEVCEDGLDNDCSGADECRYEEVVDAATDGITSWTGVNGSTATSSFGSMLLGNYDFDGDGIADVAIGDRFYDTSSASAAANLGRVLILAGTGTSITDTVASPAATVTGTDAAGRFGQGLAAGDLDGDGIDDLMVGVPGLNGSGTDNGKAYVFLGPIGPTGGATGVLTPTAADCSVEGASGNAYLGNSVAYGGDLDGDGAADWVYGAYQSHTSTLAGYVGIVTTPTCGDLSSSDTADIHTIQGAASDVFGLSVLGDLDLDGDGADDLLVVGSGTDSVYAFLGPVTATARADADAAVTSMDFIHSTSSPADVYGDRLARAGDTNGDGYAEFLVGANSYDVGTSTSAGAAFLFSGDVVVVAGSGAAADLSNVQVYGGTSTAQVGAGVSRAGDVDADGREDFLVGIGGDAVGSTTYGAAALFYGGAAGAYYPTLSGTPEGYAVFDLEATNTSNGYTGGGVAPAGDVDGDGFDDLLFANMNYSTTTRVGKVYLVGGTGQ